MQLEFALATTKYSIPINDVIHLFERLEVNQLLTECPAFLAQGEADKVSISFIGPTRMKTLNVQYRKLSTSTDVLSFEIHEQSVMGELYVCLDDVAKNAKMMGHAVDRELIEIIIHGLLHLTGRDHSDEMFGWQKSLTERILQTYEDNRRTR